MIREEHEGVDMLSRDGDREDEVAFLVQARQECFCDRLPKVGRNRYRVARATLVVLAQPRMLVRRRPVLVVP